ncbi:MAG: hypothetical protein AAGJ81_09685 [Verrucomicrobiota bacterium]
MKQSVAVFCSLLFLIASLKAQSESTVDELREKGFLFEVAQYLYRWFLDENQAQIVVDAGEAIFWVREDMKETDAGDNSRFGTIILPQLDYVVSVKKSDYRIDELDFEVKDSGFKVINVSRQMPEGEDESFEVVVISAEEIQEFAHASRMDARYPEGDLLETMRAAARREVMEYLEGRIDSGLPIQFGAISSLEDLGKTQQVVYVSPLPNVANDVWFFWETGEMLLHFSADFGLEDPALWEAGHLQVNLFDVKRQTVVSLDEVAGSNAYLTRDQVGRTLYNCIVLGKKLVLTPPANLDE